MHIANELENKFNSDDGKVYVYVSKNKVTLDLVRGHIMSNCDLGKLLIAETPAQVILVHPMGIAKVGKEVDGVYLDKEASTEEFIKNHMGFKDFLIYVNPETLEIE